MDELQNGIAEEIRILAIVESETHLREIGMQVFRADFMPRSDDAASEERTRTR